MSRDVAPSMEGCRRQPPRERRLKAGKMLQWSILSESPSSFAAKVGEAEVAERIASPGTRVPLNMCAQKKILKQVQDDMAREMFRMTDYKNYSRCHDKKSVQNARLQKMFRMPDYKTCIG